MNKRVVNFNLPQMLLALSTQKQVFCEWGRGTGKSTALGWAIREFVSQMPRASFFLVGETYQQILSRTLPSTKEGLEMFGLYEGVDYVVGTRAGKKMGYNLPFQSPDKWENILHFSNGSIFQLVSLDNANSGRGLNTYGGIGDEAALLDKERLFNNVQSTNRAKKAEFSKAKMLHREIFTSSTPMTKKGKWFVEMEKEALKNPDKVAFIKANAYANAHNLASDWFSRMKAAAPSELHYNAEILNIRPTEVVDGFYAQFNVEKHGYSDFNNGYLEELGVNASPLSFNSLQDNDVNTKQRLIISVDWGGNINSMTVSQYSKALNEYRVLKEFWVKSPDIIDDLIDKFVKYYEPHLEKKVEFYYDRNGNSKVANSKLTYAEQVEAILKRHRWKVYRKTTGADPLHMNKFLLINRMLRGGVSGLPAFLINRHNCPDTIISMEHAEAIEQGNAIKKDKSSERRKSVQQEHATHLSDTVDLPIYALFKQHLKTISDDWQVPLSLG